MQGSISQVLNFTYSHEMQRRQKMCVSHIKLFIETSLVRDIFDIRARQKQNMIKHTIHCECQSSTRIMMPRI